MIYNKSKDQKHRTCTFATSCPHLARHPQTHTVDFTEHRFLLCCFSKVAHLPEGIVVVRPAAFYHVLHILGVEYDCSERLPLPTSAVGVFANGNTLVLAVRVCQNFLNHAETLVGWVWGRVEGVDQWLGPSMPVGGPIDTARINLDEIWSTEVVCVNNKVCCTTCWTTISTCCTACPCVCRLVCCCSCCSCRVCFTATPTCR